VIETVLFVTELDGVIPVTVTLDEVLFTSNPFARVYDCPSGFVTMISHKPACLFVRSKMQAIDVDVAETPDALIGFEPDRIRLTIGVELKLVPARFVILTVLVL
jgi:hypothetical protein